MFARLFVFFFIDPPRHRNTAMSDSVRAAGNAAGRARVENFPFRGSPHATGRARVEPSS